MNILVSKIFIGYVQDINSNYFLTLKLLEVAFLSTLKNIINTDISHHYKGFMGVFNLGGFASITLTLTPITIGTQAEKHVEYHSTGRFQECVQNKNTISTI